MVNRRNAEIGTSRHLGGPALDRFRVPIVARGFRRTILVDDCIRSVRDNIADTAGKVLAVQNGVAFVVDGVTLQVHDVIVFEDVFTGCEMHGFDLALSALDRLRDHARLNGHVVFGAGLFHHAGDGIHAVPSEKTHEVVFQREIELRKTRVALAAGAAAKLIVDTAGFMTLGTDDGETSCSKDFLLFLRAYALRLVEGRLTLLGRRSGKGVGRRFLLGSAIRVEALLVKNVFHQDLGVAAEQDVGAAACHVRRNRHRADATGLGDDMRLSLVVFRIQGFMGYAAFIKQARKTFGALDGDRADKARLTSLVALCHIVGDGAEFSVGSCGRIRSFSSIRACGLLEGMATTGSLYI